jgi:hypothetical protein
MWQTNTIWLEMAVTSFFLMIGHIFFGHFEEQTPKLRKVIKALITLALVATLSILFGRAVAFTVLGLTLIPIIYIHGVWLPRKGINGWTGEPKSKYYELRGWRKDIFKE